MNRSWLSALVVLLLATGCSSHLDTRYGLRDSGTHSVNGVRVLDARLAELGSLTSFPRLSPRAAKRDMLVHLALVPELPDEEACTWIRDWLHAGPRRQFVLVLRDGNVAPWLCQHWASEIQREAAHVDGDRRKELENAAARLQNRAQLEEESPYYGPGPQHECALFRMRQLRRMPAFGETYRPEGEIPPHGMFNPMGMAALPPLHPERLAGLVAFPTPPMFSLNSAIESDHGHVLVSADEAAWAMEIPVGASRLIVMANATPLLDGAQVDMRARRLLVAVMKELATWSPQRLAWVDSLDTHMETDPEPPNLLALLFGKAPFCYAAYHLLVLMVVFVGWKATWLGRVEARPDRAVERFARHVEALALHLRRERAVSAVLVVLARALGRPAPRPTSDPAAALTIAQNLHRPPERFSAGPFVGQKENP